MAWAILYPRKQGDKATYYGVIKWVLAPGRVASAILYPRKQGDKATYYGTIKWATS